MAAKKTKSAKAVASNAADMANITNIASNPYLQRLIQDEDLRDNLQQAVQSSRSAFNRISSAKAPQRAVIDDKKLQKDLREAYEAIRGASTALTNAPKRQRARKGLGLGRKLLIVGLGAGLALGASESLRSKVLDALFGKEEEFEYTPPPSPAPAPTAAPVSAA